MEGVVELPIVQLYLKDTDGKGRGVFSLENIPKGTLVHISPVLVLQGQDNDLAQKTLLNHYTYNWGKDQAVALGLGSMFNHSRAQNVGFVRIKEKEVIEYYALRDIPPGTELCIHYGPHLWFDDADGPDDEGDVVEIEEDNSFLAVLDLWE